MGSLSVIKANCQTYKRKNQGREDKEKSVAASP